MKVKKAEKQPLTAKSAEGQPAEDAKELLEAV